MSKNTPRSWYRFENKATTPGVAELYIHGYIGRSYYEDDGVVSAKFFIRDLQALSADIKTIRVDVHSEGGDPFEAIAIANALRMEHTDRQRTIEMHISGLAASAASIVIMAGNTIRIVDNGLVMAHDPRAFIYGTAQELRANAEGLDKIRAAIIATYQWHSKLSEEELSAIMTATTWMTADEAIANGFATEKVAGLKAAAALDRSAMDHLAIPSQFQAAAATFFSPAPPAPAAPIAAAPTVVARLCREHDCLDMVEGLLEAQCSLEDVTTKVQAAKASRTAATEREQAITGVCNVAKLPNLAAGYINSAMTVEQVRAHVTLVTTALDNVEIDTSLADAGGEVKKKAAVIDVTAIYGSLNTRPAEKR